MFVELPGWAVDVQDGGRGAEAAAGGRGLDYYYEFLGLDPQPFDFGAAVDDSFALIPITGRGKSLLVSGC